MYYPKSQISTPLYTNGDKFTLNDKDYIGNYWVNSQGNSYSGKSPQDPPNNLLTPKSTPTDLSVEPTISYYKSNPSYYNSQNKKFSEVAPSPPIPSVTLPTEEDYQIGEFQRYFVKKRNELRYIEINSTTYENYVNKNQSVQWQLYMPMQISWILTGKLEDVYNINKNIVLLYQQQNKIYGFFESFKGKFTKYYK